ncbi:uncharacterized protein [Dysidea avara]|uniref:uncharacterized protein isoform X1 n=1 Tax=Dysidea avara TaxID=196820 RepID=UPI00331ABDB0
MVKRVFNYLVDHLTNLLKTSNPKKLVEACDALMASDVHQIKLFSDPQIEVLNQFSDTCALLQCLESYWSWNDHSVLIQLLRSCDEAVKLLYKYDDQLDPCQLIATYPIPSLSPDMIPKESSPHTILAIRCSQEVYSLSLQYVYDMRSLMVEKCDITLHCLQLLAVNANPTIIYWTIPKCVVDLVVTKVMTHRDSLHDQMVLEVYIHPSIRVDTNPLNCLDCLFYLPQMDWLVIPWSLFGISG